MSFIGTRDYRNGYRASQGLKRSAAGVGPVFPVFSIILKSPGSLQPERSDKPDLIDRH